MSITAGDIIKKLEQEYPYAMALDWDNPGLQVGRPEYEVKKVVVALDATDAVVERCAAEGAQLLLTHHPLLMSGIRQINPFSMHGRRILTLIEHRIAHFAMHTNYDTARMGALAGVRLGLVDRAILEVTGENENGPYGIGETGTLPEEMTAETLCHFVKKAFDLDGVRLFGDPKQKVCRVAVSPGSGKSMIRPALESGVDLLITGDIGHHDGIDAVDQGMLVIDAGHYGIEHIFTAQMSTWVRENWPELEVVEITDQPPYRSV